MNSLDVLGQLPPVTECLGADVTLAGATLGLLGHILLLLLFIQTNTDQAHGVIGVIIVTVNGQRGVRVREMIKLKLKS